MRPLAYVFVRTGGVETIVYMLVCSCADGKNIIPEGGFKPIDLFTSADGALWRDNRAWEWAGQDGIVPGDCIGLMLNRQWASDGGIGTIVRLPSCRLHHKLADLNPSAGSVLALMASVLFV